jgi:hypothetical protein
MWKWVMGIVSKQLKQEEVQPTIKLETTLTSEELE